MCVISNLISLKMIIITPQKIFLPFVIRISFSVWVSIINSILKSPKCQSALYTKNYFLYCVFAWVFFFHYWNDHTPKRQKEKLAPFSVYMFTYVNCWKMKNLHKVFLNNVFATLYFKKYCFFIFTCLSPWLLLYKNYTFYKKHLFFSVCM